MKERFLISGGIVRDGGRVALVQNRWPVGTFWTLPGGRLEPVESLAEAAVREIAEETGLSVEPVCLAFVMDYYNREWEMHFLWSVFDCRLRGGEIRPPQGDPHLVDARWVPVAEVADYMVWPQYRDPVVDFLAGRHRPYYEDKDAGYRQPGSPGSS